MTDEALDKARAQRIGNAILPLLYDDVGGGVARVYPKEGIDALLACLALLVGMNSRFRDPEQLRLVVQSLSADLTERVLLAQSTGLDRARMEEH